MWAVLALGSSGCATIPVASADPAGEDEHREVVSAACKIADCYAEGEVREFVLAHRGRDIATSWGRYVGPVTVEGRTLYAFESRFESQMGVEEGGEALRSALDLWFDDQGRLVKAREVGATARLDIEVRGEELRAVEDTGLPTALEQRTRVSPYPQNAGVMGYMTLILEELMLAQRSLSPGLETWPLVSLSSPGVREWSASVALQDPVGPQLALQTNLGEHIIFSGGKITRLEIPDDQLSVEVRHPPGPWPQWRPEGPKALQYRTDPALEMRELQIPRSAADPELAGEIVMARGTSGTQSRPGVLFLSGSVPVDRYGYAGPPAVDFGSHELSDALAHAGFVVLRFDDRGRGRSEHGRASWRGDLQDARRALASLLVQAEVDPDRIIVVGHGEGGWRGLHLARARPREIIGVALLAAPGRPYSEILAEAPALLRAVQTGVGAPSTLRASVDWYREILEEQPEALVRGAPCPLWIAGAGKDFEVEGEAAARRLWSALARAKPHEPSKSRLELFPGLDHLFKPEPGSSSPSRYQIDRRVDAQFLAKLTSWAKDLAGLEP